MVVSGHDGLGSAVACPAGPLMCRGRAWCRPSGQVLDGGHHQAAHGDGHTEGPAHEAIHALFHGFEAPVYLLEALVYLLEALVYLLEALIHLLETSLHGIEALAHQLPLVELTRF